MSLLLHYRRGLLANAPISTSSIPYLVSRIPASDTRVIDGHTFQRVHARRLRWIRIQPVLEDLFGRLLVPEPVIPRAAGGVLPKERVSRHFGCPLDIFQLGQFVGCLLR